MALAIDTEFHRDMAIHHIIALCRQANDLATERSLFKMVRDASVREILLKHYPECEET
jgi:sigma54-dependent transcription regulator